MMQKTHRHATNNQKRHKREQGGKGKETKPVATKLKQVRSTLETQNSASASWRCSHLFPPKVH